MANLPVDVWNLIFQYLPPPDLLSLSLTNSLFKHQIIPSHIFRRWYNLCPAHRKPLAMTWEHARYIHSARLTGLKGTEQIFRDPEALDADTEIFDGIVPFPDPKQIFPDLLFEQEGRELIDLAGLTSARDGLVQYVSEMDTHLGFMTLPRIVNSWRINLSKPFAIEPGIRTALPPERHLVRPSGEQLVGGTLLWIDDIINPLYYTHTSKGIQFRVSPEGGQSPSPFEFSFMTAGDESMTSRYSDIIMRWLSMMSPLNQMFSAVSALKNRKQTLYVYDVFENILKKVDVRTLLGEGYWRAPWILPMGSDNKGNLIVKIVDSDRDPKSDGIRLVQRTFDMDLGEIRWSIMMERAVSTTPWDSHLFNDHCCGYIAKQIHPQGTQLYSKIYDLEEGQLISTIGPFPSLLDPTCQRYQSILTSFLFIFQDRSKAFSPLPPHTGTNPCPLYFYKITTGEFLYRIDPPVSPLFESPRSWIHRGEDASERYLLLNGVGQREDVNGIGWPERLDGSKKWLVLDTVRGEWLFATSGFERWRFLNQGVHVLYRERGRVRDERASTPTGHERRDSQGEERGEMYDEEENVYGERDMGDIDSIANLRFVYARINIPVLK